MEDRLLMIMIAVILFAAVSLIGSYILQRIANKKWGYTPKREKELEEQKDLRITGRYGKIVRRNARTDKAHRKAGFK